MPGKLFAGLFCGIGMLLFTMGVVIFGMSKDNKSVHYYFMGIIFMLFGVLAFVPVLGYFFLFFIR